MTDVNGAVEVVSTRPSKRPGTYGMGPRKICSECGRSYSVRHIGNHLRNVHGIWGGLSGRVRGGSTETKVEAKPETKQMAIYKPETVKKSSFKVMPFVVLEDQDGGLWLAEKIK